MRTNHLHELRKADLGRLRTARRGGPRRRPRAGPLLLLTDEPQDAEPTTDVAPPVPVVGSIVPGYEIPVIDERAVRAAAGLLFLAGATTFGYTLAAGTPQALQPFGILFMVDMLIRLTLGDRWSPSIAAGRLIVRRQRPEWVGAPQKEFAWWLGLGLAVISCGAMGLFAAPLWVTLALCGLCLALLFLETAFSICVGCALQRLLSRTPPRHCPGDACATGDRTP